jgi:ABC-type glutathione transport system ATPase component
MLVGETGSGKTTCYEVLQEICTKLREENNKDIRF